MSVFGRSVLVVSLMVSTSAVADERPLQPVERTHIPYTSEQRSDTTALNYNFEGERFALGNGPRKGDWKRRAKVRALFSDADKALSKGDPMTACELAQKAEATDFDYAETVQHNTGKTKAYYCEA